MTEKEEKQRKERRAKRIKRDKMELKSERTILWISFSTGVAFAVAEFISALFTHSQSVLMDAAYDSTELIVIILTLFLTPLFHKPVSEKRP
ncbi:cation diffusion facilitator family transporter, partial [gut metagenome]